METIADLHLHSRYSIATGKEADLEHLDLWGRYKGLQVIGYRGLHPPGVAQRNGRQTGAGGVRDLRPEGRPGACP